mmetsp:Transcript_12179/g.24992  ORF Transcript_12179/g.24992 Transcript_12179/m.24992 type:complete len:243 (+) Transcript_12179:67-795(+)
MSRTFKNGQREGSLQSVIDIIGIEIFSNLEPKDVCNLSQTSQYLSHEINTNLVKICSRYLPLHLGTGTNYLAQFSKECSYPSKQELLNDLLQKIEKSGLILSGTDNMADSLTKTRKLLSSEQSNATFKHPDSLINDRIPPVTVECHYESNIDNNTALFWGKYIIDRDSCKNNRGRNQQIAKRYRFMKDWLTYILSRRTLIFDKWRWSCKHSSLLFEGVAGVGVIISDASRQETIAIKLLRKY